MNRLLECRHVELCLADDGDDVGRLVAATDEARAELVYVAVTIWVPWRWWQPLARLLAIQVVLTPAALLPSLLLWLLFDVHPDRRQVAAGHPDHSRDAGRGLGRHEDAPPTQVTAIPATMVPITGMASHSASPWGPLRYLRDELLPWGNEHNVGLYAAAALPAHARLYRGAAFVPAPEHGLLALIRTPGGVGCHLAGRASDGGDFITKPRSHVGRMPTCPQSPYGRMGG